MPRPLPIRFSVEKLKEMLEYTAETGEFRWRASPAPSIPAGSRAGYKGAAGSEYIMIDYKPYPASRLAWYYTYGATPLGLIRHLNGDGMDNRIANLVVSAPGSSRPQDISLENLRELLHYDHEDGMFYAKFKRSGRPSKVDADGVENRVGFIRRDGYVAISVMGFTYLAHRLAWFYVKGEWPPEYLDHVDGDRTNNRIDNLREATPIENSRNGGFRKNNTSGHRGVSFDKVKKKWVARIVHNYRQMVLGYFEHLEDAVAAYNRKSEELHGEFARKDGDPVN